MSGTTFTCGGCGRALFKSEHHYGDGDPFLDPAKPITAVGGVSMPSRGDAVECPGCGKTFVKATSASIGSSAIR